MTKSHTYTDEQITEEQKKRVRTQLLNGSSYGLPYTSGTRWSNFKQLVYNRHPIIGIFKAHDIHPLTRRERIVVLICTLSFLFLLNAFVNPPIKASCKIECNDFKGEHPSDWYKQLDNYECPYNDGTVCTSGCNDGMGYPGVNPCISDKLQGWIRSAFISLIYTPYSFLVALLATCPCVQRSSKAVRKWTQRVGYVLLVALLLASVLFVWLGVILIYDLPAEETGTVNGSDLIVPYVIAWARGIALTWVGTWFLINAALFLLITYRKDKKKFNKEHPGYCALSWPIDYKYDTVVAHADGKPVVYFGVETNPEPADTTKVPSKTAVNGSSHHAPMSGHHSHQRSHI